PTPTYPKWGKIPHKFNHFQVSVKRKLLFFYRKHPILKSAIIPIFDIRKYENGDNYIAISDTI
ncbi:MAG: hypothetical protein K1W31_19160, partial [Lachnospiraceae bacterium]